MERAASQHGLDTTLLAMSDGGEGFVDALGGDVRHVEVHGPLGAVVSARWAMLDDATAIVESAQAAGRALLPFPSGDDPIRATTAGVGETICEAIAAGARKVVVGCGGSASTDGGVGCVEAVVGRLGVVTVPLVAACDVRVPFFDAASVFAPQKGATPDQVAYLSHRLAETARYYLGRFGVDVEGAPGAGAAGGLAGGLIALGASVVSGAHFVAEQRGLAVALGGADLVITGEGSFDDQTLEGKVVEVVLATRPELPALIVAGRGSRSSLEALRAQRPGPVDLVVLDAALQATVGTQRAITAAVDGYLSAR